MGQHSSLVVSSVYCKRLPLALSMPVSGRQAAGFGAGAQAQAGRTPSAGREQAHCAESAPGAQVPNAQAHQVKTCKHTK